MSRRRRRPEVEEVLDLDVAPFLNVVFMLILSVMATTSFTQLALLAVDAVAGAGVAAAAPPTVHLGADAIDVDVPASGQRTRIAKAGGAHDWAALHGALIAAKAAHPTEDTLVLGAAPDVPYDDVVRAMDAARVGDDGRPLFPAVALAGAAP